jgi:replicative DNA helicase
VAGDGGERHGGDGGRLPPHNLEAERCALGALLVDVYSASAVFQLLGEEDFYLQAHQHIYRTLTGLYDRIASADIVLVGEVLAREKLLADVGGEEYLLRLAEDVPSAANAVYYAQLVRDASIRRHLVQKCTTIINEAYDGRGEAREQLDRAEQNIFEIAGNNISGDFVPIPELIDPVFDMIDKDHRGAGGIGSGYTKFDELTNGLHPAELIVVAGRPSMGKTTFALNIARHVALKLGKPVGIFSLEVSRTQVVQNLLCSEARVDAQKVRQCKLSPREWQDLIATADKLRRAPIYIDDSSSLTTLDVKAKARRLRARYGVELLIIDYMQLMQSPGVDSRQEEISQISRGLKGAARDLNVPVIAVSQLSRAVESREGHKPRLSDLRESGAIEQDADLVVLLYREEYYKREDPDVRGKAEVIVAKQRNGPTGTIQLAFIGNMLRFEDLATETEPTY